MCGIVGYVGGQEAVPVIIEGLRRLEYRGYDSAGIAVVDEAGELNLRRASGKLRNLEEVLKESPIAGDYGVGHTRWATHGRPTEENAHPHRDCTGRIVVVHNGIIENYLTLKRELQAKGHHFVTETDTEVIAHLIEAELKGGASGGFPEAVRRALGHVRGIYALAALSADDPHRIVAARLGPPIVIGLADSEYFVASDIPAILPHTRDMVFLDDGDVAVIDRSGVRVFDEKGVVSPPKVQHITWDPVLAEKGGYRHFMLKEVFEQPRAVRDTAQGRISVDTGHVFLEEVASAIGNVRDVTDIKIAACGTAWHAALVGKHLIEELSRIPVEVDYASEFRYRKPILSSRTLMVVISQSGETADTLAALREAKSQGCRTVAICNVPGAMMTREADGTLYTHAGPEIGVASTKAFTSQLVAAYLLALFLGQERGTLGETELRLHAQMLSELPVRLESLLESGVAYDELAREFFRATDFLYLGRGISFPIALEGALKLKEILLHSCGRLCCRRDEAWAECTHRREPAGSDYQYARF